MNERDNGNNRDNKNNRDYIVNRYDRYGGDGRDDRNERDREDGYDKFDTRISYKYPTSSRTSPNRKAEHEGVEYIPSGKSRTAGGASSNGRRSAPSGARPVRSGGTQGSYGSRGGKGTGTRSPQRRRITRRQSQSAVYIAIIIGAVVLFFVGAVWWYNHMKQGSDKTTNPENGNSAVSEDSKTGDNEAQGIIQSDSEIVGAIKEISNGTVTVINYENDRDFDLFVNQDTQLRNKYGQAMTLSQFGEGDIIIAEYDSVTKRAQVFKLDPESWAKASIKNIEINSDTDTVKAGNDTLTVSPAALFLPSGTVGVVKPSDVVTLKGRKTKIMAVVVEKRSGTIEFSNKDKIADGTVEIDSDIYKALEETGVLRVATGEHTVVVKGSNIEVFIKDVTVREGETLVIDLGEAQVKEGIVNLVVNEPDYTLFINDEQAARSSEPLKLGFGAYKLKVTKEGYTSWEGNVTVNQPSVTVNVTLTAEVKMGRVTVYIESPFGLGASVYIDNALIGTAPIDKASVTYGTHVLTVTAPGYINTSTDIIVEGDVTYRVTMHPVNDNANNMNPPDTGNTGGMGNTGETGNSTDIPDYDPTL